MATKLARPASNGQATQDDQAVKEAWQIMKAAEEDEERARRAHRQAEIDSRAATKEFYNTVARVHALIPMPLFDAAQNGLVLEGEAAAVPLAEVFERAGLSETVTAACRAERLTTAGELADWLKRERTEDDGLTRLNRLTDLHGVGDAKAARMKEALHALAARGGASGEG